MRRGCVRVLRFCTRTGAVIARLRAQHLLGDSEPSRDAAGDTGTAWAPYTAGGEHGPRGHGALGGLMLMNRALEVYYGPREFVGLQRSRSPHTDPHARPRRTSIRSLWPTRCPFSC